MPAGLQPALLGRRVVDVEAAALLAARDPAGLEAERAQQALAALRLRRVRAHAGEAADAVLLRDVGRVRDERLLAGVVDEQLQREPLRVVEDERTVADLAADALLPEVERLLGADAEGDEVHHPVARAPSRRAGVLEERDVGARGAALVGVEEVVDGRVVLVDRLLDHPQAELARVELDVRRRVAGDARDVVDAFELHRA